MKKLLFLIGAFLVYSFTYAQKQKEANPDLELKSFKNPPEWFRYYKSPKLQGPLLKIPLDTTFKFHNEMVYEPKAKFLYETDKGSVYALPLDNMPCLRPGIHSDMPVARLSQESYIPNALNVQPGIHGKVNILKIIPPVK